MAGTAVRADAPGDFRHGNDEVIMGGNQVPPHSTDNWDAEGYDEAQRAEIIEATQDGPSNGAIMTDIPLGLDDPDSVSNEDDLRMVDGEVGEEDDDADMDEGDMREDDLQADLDDEDVDEDELDDETGDEDDAFLQP